jgi:hypothetical protein
VFHVGQARAKTQDNARFKLKPRWPGPEKPRI